MHRAKGDRLVRASVLPVCDNALQPARPYNEEKEHIVQIDYMYLIIFTGSEAWEQDSSPTRQFTDTVF